MGYVGKNPKFDSTILKDLLLTTPGNPASGSTKVINRNGKLYLRDSSGNETPIGSASSSGRNYMSANPDFESGVTGYSTYADAAGVAPVDGTGGSPNITFTRSTSSPLRGAASGLLTKDAANRQGEGVSYPIALDLADISKNLTISFDVNASDSGYTDDELYVYVYDVTNAAVIYPSFQKIKKSTYSYLCTFAASTSQSYRLCIHVAGTSASAYAIKFDNFQLGPSIAIQGVPMWTRDVTSLVTIPASFGTVTNLKVMEYRYGDMARYSGFFNVGTTTSAVATLTLPTGRTIDSTRLQTSSKGKLGIFERITTSGSAETIYDSGNAGVLFFDGTNQLVKFGFQSQSSAFVNANANAFASTSGTGLTLDFWVPIAEWSGSNVNLSTALPEYAYNTNTTSSDDLVSFGYGTLGALMPNRSAGTGVLKNVRWLNDIQATDMIVWQIWDGFTWYDGAQLYPQTTQNAKDYGVGFVSIDSRTTQIYFGNGGFRSSSGSYGANGQPWSDLFTSNYKWRVVKIPGQVQVASPVSTPRCEVLLTTANGHGSSSTANRRFTTSTVTGDALTYPGDSATLGAEITVRRGGLYTCYFQDERTSNQAALFVTRNSTKLTTGSLPLTTDPFVELYSWASVNGNPGGASVTFWCDIGDIVRPQGNGNSNGTSGVKFRMTLVSLG